MRTCVAATVLLRALWPRSRWQLQGSPWGRQAAVRLRHARTQLPVPGLDIEPNSTLDTSRRFYYWCGCALEYIKHHADARQ